MYSITPHRCLRACAFLGFLTPKKLLGMKQVKTPTHRGPFQNQQRKKLPLPAPKHTVPTGDRVRLGLHELIPTYKGG